MHTCAQPMAARACMQSGHVQYEHISLLAHVCSNMVDPALSGTSSMQVMRGRILGVATSRVETLGAGENCKC